MNTDSNYLPFGPVARRDLGMQCQYAARYLDDPVLSKDIRWSGTTDNYHGITIHKLDVETFVNRVTAYRRATGQIA